MGLFRYWFSLSTALNQALALAQYSILVRSESNLIIAMHKQLAIHSVLCQDLSVGYDELLPLLGLQLKGNEGLSLVNVIPNLLYSFEHLDVRRGVVTHDRMEGILGH